MAGELAFAKITGSGHDFSNKSWSGGEICLPCHIPHNAKANTEIKVPLWNHTVTTATFQIYSSTTLKTTTIGQPSASSRACLSCHDGTVAYNAFGSNKTGTESASGALNLGTDLSNDHPVSFTYDKNLSDADTGLYNPLTQSVAQLDNKTIDQAMLIDHKVECATCHDVHAAKGKASNANLLLVVDNANSALCLTCHNK